MLLVFGGGSNGLESAGGVGDLSPVVVPPRICAAVRVRVRSPLHPGVVLSVTDN